MLSIAAAGGASSTRRRRNWRRPPRPPSISISTPHDRLRTKPATPSESARRHTNGRNPTPCTVPLTTRRSRERPSVPPAGAWGSRAHNRTCATARVTARRAVELSGRGACAGADAISIPITLPRSGARPNLHASSTAAATPSPCEKTKRAPNRTVDRPSSPKLSSWRVPGGAPDRTASISIAASIPSSRSTRPALGRSAADYFAIGGWRQREDSCGLEPGRIVAKRTSDADDANQWRSISSVRKCVEHEIHGS
jgi:hypothetical protein